MAKKTATQNLIDRLKKKLEKEPDEQKKVELFGKIEELEKKFGDK